MNLLYRICSTLLRSNTEAGYSDICREISQELSLTCCSIWLLEANGLRRLSYFERDFSIEDLTVSNVDFEIASYVLNEKTPFITDNLKTDKRFSRLATTPLSVLGIPINSESSVVGCVLFYRHEPINDWLSRILTTIAKDLAFSLEQFKFAFTVARQKRLRKELETAYRIQQNLLPKVIPKTQGITLGARSIPTYEISGDYYDFVITDHNNLGIVIGDVMGKGVPAALYMAVARTVTRATIKHDLAPNAALSEINDTLFSELSSQGMFLTMFYTLYNPLQRALLYSSAGHNPPLFFEAKSSKVVLLKSKGIIIGGRAKLSYSLQTRKLESGDIVIFYTDGLVEARNQDGEQFGVKRLGQVVAEYRHCDVSTLIDCLSMRVLQFIGKQEQSDDMTFVVLKTD